MNPMMRKYNTIRLVYWNESEAREHVKLLNQLNFHAD